MIAFTCLPYVLFLCAEHSFDIVAILCEKYTVLFVIDRHILIVYLWHSANLKPCLRIIKNVV